MVYKYNTLTSSLEWHFKIFYPNGISSTIVPRVGLYNYGPNADIANNPGIYSFDGTNGTNKVSPQSQYNEVLSLQSITKLKIDNDVYQRCASTEGKKLNGSYTSYADPNDPTLQTLPYGQKPVITFHSDGTFLDEGLFNTAFVLDPQPAPGSGTYEIKNFSIIMKYTDNRVRQCSIYSSFSNDITTANVLFLENFDLNKM